MVQASDFNNILFLDIETVPMLPDYHSLPENFTKLWNRKAEKLKKDKDENPEQLYEKAGIYAEFGKIICISTGYFNSDEFRIKSFYGDDEKKILIEFANLLNTFFNKNEYKLCAHNGKEFDFPYISRRMLINGIQIPQILDNSGKKPWEVRHLDTMEMWKFGDYKNYTSLELLAAVFEIPTPKNDIAGSDVARVYWQEHDLYRIVIYCQKDVLTIAQLMRKFSCLPMIAQEKIVII